MSRSSHTTARPGIALVAVVSLVVAGLVASVPARAASPTPEQTVRRFVASVNARKADCSLMLDDLVELMTFPAFVGQSPFAPEVPTQQQRLASCRVLIRGFNGGDDSLDTWRRTVIEHLSIAARADRLVRLRVHLRHVHRYHVDDVRSNVWLEREEGRWKVATQGDLLELTSVPVPTSLRRWRTYRGRLALEAATHRAELERRVASAQELTVPVRAEPLSCDGPVSMATDPPGDAEFASGGDLIPDQSRATIDMLAASLHSRDGQYCWEVQFARPPGSRYELHVAVSRRSRIPAQPNVQPNDFGQAVTIVIKDGTALAGVDADWSDGPGAQDFVPVAVSQADSVVRVSLARGDLFHRAGPFDGRHSFRWRVESFGGPWDTYGQGSETDTLTGPPHVP